MMTLNQIQAWADAHVINPIASRVCRATEQMYINRICFENGDRYEFSDIEGQGITVKINGETVYQG